MGRRGETRSCPTPGLPGAPSTPRGGEARGGEAGARRGGEASGSVNRPGCWGPAVLRQPSPQLGAQGGCWVHGRCQGAAPQRGGLLSVVVSSELANWQNVTCSVSAITLNAWR